MFDNLNQRSISFITAVDILDRACHELNPSSAWPIALEPVLNQLGIVHRHIEAQGRQGVAYLRLGEPPIISLVRSGSGDPELTGRDRFSVAHELAHYILWQRCKVPPASTRSQYWQYEALCNRFASQLLVSPTRLRSFLNTVDVSIPAVHYPRLVANKANVTWTVAARALSIETRSHLCYLRLSCKRDQSDLIEVDCSSMGYGFQGSVGQSAHLRDIESAKNLMMIRWAAEHGYGSLYKMPVTLTIGRLRLKAVHCNVLYHAQRWIVHFAAVQSNTVASSDTTGIKLSDTDDASAQISRNQHWEDVASEPFTPSNVSSTLMVTPIQQMAIKRLMNSLGISGFNEVELLSRHFQKIKLAHLTRQEGAILLKDLQSH